MKKLSTILFLLIGALAYSQEGYKYSEPEKLADGWETGTLKSCHFDSARVYQLFNQLQGGEHKIHGIVLVKNDQIIIEEYFNDYSVNKQHTLRSATKSVTSILMGIAIDKGFIDDIDTPITKYVKDLLPEKHLDKRKEEITLRHLLTMSTGLDCNDWDRRSKGREDKVHRKNHWLQYFLALPVINEPGTVSAYCTMGQVLAMEIISRASGMPINRFAEKYLFAPLGIKNVSWGHTSKKEVLPSAKRLYMTPRDMAKIGQLVLNRGKWNGQQIVSEEWIARSTTPKTKITGIDYGFLWWDIPFEVNGRTVVAKTATGNGGQYIFILPDLDLVVVFTGGAYNSPEDKLPFAIMRDVFLPTFMN